MENFMQGQDDSDVIIIKRKKDNEVSSLLKLQTMLLRNIAMQGQRQQQQMDMMAYKHDQGVRAVMSKPVTPPIVHVTTPAPIVKVTTPKAKVQPQAKPFNYSKIQKLYTGQMKQLLKQVNKKKGRDRTIVVQGAQPKFSPMG
jgi:hypothetical protein